MKKWATAFTICVTLLAACDQGATQPSSTATAIRPTLVTTAVQPTITAAATQPTKANLPESFMPTLPPNQEDLKDEWRPVFNGSMILFASCELMFDTHIKYQKGEIDMTEARSELTAESDFISIVYRGYVGWANPSDDVAPHKENLERDMGVLIELWSQMDNGDIGSPEVTDPLFETCSSLFDIQDRIVNAAMDAGMTKETADELALEIEDILEDLYNSVRGDN